MRRRRARKAGTNGCEDDLLDAIGSLYDAALSPQLWPAALSQVARVCGSAWTVFSVIPFGFTEPPMTVHSGAIDSDLLARLIGRYATPQHNPSIPVLLASPLGRINLREAYFSDAEWERTELFNEVYRPMGFRASLGVPLLRSPACFVPFGMMRARVQGEFDDDALAMLSRLIPHLQRAVSLMMRLASFAGRADALADAWNQLALGLVMLDSTARILWCNRASERILAQNDGLSARGGVLTATAASVNAQLQRLLSEAGQTANGHGRDSGGVIVVPRHPPARPLSLTVSPCRLAESHPPFAPKTAAALALISDPDHKREPPRALLQRLYRLTEREVALAALLLEGSNLREASGTMGVTLETVRTHLRQLLAKTGTRRQAELISVLSRSVAGRQSE